VKELIAMAIDGRRPPVAPRDAASDSAPKGSKAANGGPGNSAGNANPPTPWKTEGVPPSPNPGGGGAGKMPWRMLLITLGVILVLNLVLSTFALSSPSKVGVSYTFFSGQVSSNNISQITSTGDSITGTLKKAVEYPSATAKNKQSVTNFKTQRPSFAEDNLYTQLKTNGVTINAQSPDAGAPFWEQLLVGVGPTILIFGLLFWGMRRLASSAGGLGGLGGIGRSRAKRYEPEGGPRTTFADVAGIDEVEAEVEEIVDFLRRPQKYQKLGAQIPHGILLSGPPGTGKTLLARATAGEANVPFFSISASEFIEMIVGVGASRVRDLFSEAKKVAPSIIFIDELDAIGRARGGAGSIGGTDEREQTLNQILTEMDGFTGNEGVVVMAATNRPEVLDQALLRPGRFDRRVSVSAPDLRGRAAILAVHSRSIPLAPDVDLEQIAASTSGMVGADLKNLLNESALNAARREHAQVQNADVTDALEKVLLGTARGIMLSEGEKTRTAVHESGHALLGMLTPGADPVRKISIIPRGQALGVTFQSPQEDRYGYSAEYLRGRIIGALGGRAAEEVVYGDMTTGAESDLDQCTRIARQMVGRWGMSPGIGPVSVLPAPGQETPFGSDPASDATKQLIDEEVRRIIEECHVDAVRILGEHRPQLDALSGALLRAETLDEKDAYAAAGIDPAQAPGARARGDAPGTEPAPGVPPATAAESVPEVEAPSGH
jgi:cell division protease FtsH